MCQVDCQNIAKFHLKSVFSVHILGLFRTSLCVWYMYMFLCWGQRFISGISLGFCPTYFLRQCLLLNLEFTCAAKLPSQWAPGILPTTPIPWSCGHGATDTCHNPNFFKGAGGPIRFLWSRLFSDWAISQPPEKCFQLGSTMNILSKIHRADWPKTKGSEPLLSGEWDGVRILSFLPVTPAAAGVWCLGDQAFHQHRRRPSSTSLPGPHYKGRLQAGRQRPWQWH